MLKKFFAIAFFGATLIFAGLQSPAKAKDVWVASKDGGHFYVATETYEVQGDDSFSVFVKIVSPSAPDFNDAYYYTFRRSSRGWLFYTSQTGKFYPVSDNPVSQKILDYCLNNFWFQ